MVLVASSVLSGGFVEVGVEDNFGVALGVAVGLAPTTWI